MPNIENFIKRFINTFTVKDKEKIIPYLKKYMTNVEFLDINNTYDNYMNIQANIIQTTIDNQKRNNENVGSLINKLVYSIENLYQKDKHTEFSNEVLLVIRRMLFELKTNFKFIDKIFILNEDGIVLNYPEISAHEDLILNRYKIVKENK